MTLKLLGDPGSAHDAGEDRRVRGVGGELHLVEVEVLEEAMFFLR